MAAGVTSATTTAGTTVTYVIGKGNHDPASRTELIHKARRRASATVTDVYLQ
jgi:hypothetical protein